MNNDALRNEIEMRMNPEDFTITSSDLIDIINMFNTDEHAVVQIYSDLVADKQSELKETADEVLDYFREKGNYRPSFEEFKQVFNQYEERFIDNNILRDMHKNGINDKNQLSLFEIQKIIREELKSINEREYTFDDEYDEDFEAARAEKNWGGAGEPEEEFDAEEFFGAAGDAAEDDIRAEFGDDEFTPFGTMEDPRMLKNLKENDLRHVIGPNSGLFRPQDSEGNALKLKSIVKHIGSEKRGRVIRFGDDGNGSLVVVVEWAWPTDMKFTNPEEMGEKNEVPEHLIVQGINEGDDEYGRDNLRGVKVTYGDGSVINTSMAAHLTDDEINDYFAKGKMFNIGSVEDNMQPVADVEIFRENLNINTMNEELNEEENLRYLIQFPYYADSDEEVVSFLKDLGDKIGHEYFTVKKHNLDNNKIEDWMEMDSTEVNFNMNEDICDTDASEGDAEETIEEMRGLGSGVKNSGDRNVKLRDDHAHSPLTNLNESVNASIKNLFEGKVTKKALKEFIFEEAKKVAKNLKG